MSFFDTSPIWVIAGGLLLVFAGAVWLGFTLGQRRRERAEGEVEGETGVSGTALAAMLTLTGFLLAFTFSVAGSHFDDRRQLVIDDANVIAGTFAYANFLQEPYRANIQRLLIEYVEFRPSITAFEGSSTRFDEFISRSERLQEQMLEEGTAAAQLDPTSITAGFVNSLNSVIDIDNTRTNLRWNRIPQPVFLALAFLAALSMILVGYVRGLINRAALVSVILLAITYVTVFHMVIDLDRHTRGVFSVSQQPMIELRESLQGP